MFGISQRRPDPRAVAALGDLAEPQFQQGLVIRRASGMLLGIETTQSSSSSWASAPGILITRLREDGLIAAWNALITESRRVYTGDLIFQVNDVYGDPISMITEIKSKEELTLYMLRMSDREVEVPLRGDLVEGFEFPMTPPLPQHLEQVLPDSSQPHPGEAPLFGIGAEAGDDTTRLGIGAESRRLSAAQQAGSRLSAHVEALLPQISALSDEALGSLLCAALESRPQCHGALLDP
mmetsp:Transcript_78508/g.243509  ORF Transcript_78508/g.243509 Transcript_78508/m.243509 type:complete len:237 (+) Transcript_78508:150-860(+)